MLGHFEVILGPSWAHLGVNLGPLVTMMMMMMMMMMTIMTLVLSVLILLTMMTSMIIKKMTKDARG